ncbi:MAG TPA: hypothetical protein PKN36_07405, partial [bacterium]|nr:hypothetical protein [bacterium]
MYKAYRFIYLVFLMFFSRNIFALTWNVARPYSKDSREVNLPSFSRVRHDLIFRKGDIIEIFFYPRKRPFKVEWQLSYNMVKKSFKEGTGETCLDRSVRIVVPSEGLSPGFFDLHVRVYITDAEWEEGFSTFGYRIDEMSLTQTTPPDFQEFWKDAVSELEKEPLNPEIEFICEMNDSEISSYNVNKASRPEDYDPEGKKFDRISVYKINFNAAGQRFYGWLTVPVGKGPFPALLIVPGAGIGRQPIPAEQARHGFVTLMLQVYPGLDVDLEKYPRIPEYMKYNKQGFPEKITDEYYLRMFQGCVQAVNYLKTRTDVNSSRIAG